MIDMNKISVEDLIDYQKLILGFLKSYKPQTLKQKAMIDKNICRITSELVKYEKELYLLVEESRLKC